MAKQRRRNVPPVNIHESPQYQQKVTEREQKKPQEFPSHLGGYPVQPRDCYDVDGVRYIREDLVPDKMAAIMERIAVAQETQSKFYEKYDKMMSPLIDTYMKTIAEQVEKLKKKGFGSGQTIGGFPFES